MFSKDIIARFQEIATPFYYYDMDLLRQTLQACKDAAAKHDFSVHYAMKANFNSRILENIGAYGFGADCVSFNEVKTALQHGFAKEEVVFAGVGKTNKEIAAALDADIYCFNVESVMELSIINDLAASKNKIANVAIRINPNVDARTHHYITTGLDENKFGINMWQLPDVAATLRTCSHLHFLGIHFHIGSQITELEVYRSLCIRINEMQRWFEDHGFMVKVLNTGGGLGVDYYNPEINPICDFESYFKVFKDFLEVRPGQEVHFELGRALVAQSATLVSRVLYVKNGLKKNFLILDAGMTELIRPMLYQAYQKIEYLTRSDNLSFSSMSKYDVVGPVCESTDCFQKDVVLPESFRDDLIAIRSVGAYTEVMASNYNLRDRAERVYSDDISLR